MIPASNLGALPSADPRRRRCPRCGVSRQVNRGNRGRLCSSCEAEVADLHETEVWR